VMMVDKLPQDPPAQLVTAAEHHEAEVSQVEARVGGRVLGE
jgi:hypothetical protein